MEQSQKKLLIITGPTATGKTRIGIELAKRLEGEIISADSRQVYKLLEIGTAKPSRDEREEAVHHLIDIVFPDQTYSAGVFARDARAKIEQLLNRGKLPIIVGGTGLYLKALTKGLFQGPAADPELRKRLNQEAEQYGSHNLYKKLQELDPVTAGRISAQDRIRIIRALEIYELTGQPISFWHTKDQHSSEYRFMTFGITMNRDTLYQRINARVDRMMQAGFLDEVQNLRNLGYSFQLPALRTFGYMDILHHLQGEVELKVAVEKFKQKTRNFAKRQLTWFRHQRELKWVDADETEPVEVIQRAFESA